VIYINSYDLIGTVDDIIHLSIKTDVYIEIEEIDDNLEVDILKKYEESYLSIMNITYNMTVKVNDIDNYEILELDNTFSKNTIYLDMKNLIHNLYQFDFPND